MIRVSNLSKDFRLSRKQRREQGPQYKNAKTIRAVDNVTFECKPGRVFGLIGPNGAGKTTILRIIATMLKPTEGSVTVAGFDTLQKPKEVRRNIGFMTAQTALYDRLTPTEMVQYIADLYGMEMNHFEERKDKIFSMLDMGKFADRRIARLSSGMKQKTSIARTIIHDPDVVVFDEPTTGLDVMTARRIIELIRSCREESKTVIFSTHQMSEVKLLCDDLAIIHEGRLFFNGSRYKFEGQMKETTYEDEFIRLVGEA
jgi:sodium transport system ATP-binding protein